MLAAPRLPTRRALSARLRQPPVLELAARQCLDKPKQPTHQDLYHGSVITARTVPAPAAPAAAAAVFLLSLLLGCLVACHELMWLLFFRLLFLVVAAVRAIAEPVQPHKTFALHLVQISSQPCFHPFPPSRFSSSLPFTTDIFLDPGSWSVTVTVPCPFHPLLCPVLSCPILSCPALPGLPGLLAALQMQSCSSYSLVRSVFFSLILPKRPQFTFPQAHTMGLGCHRSGFPLVPGPCTSLDFRSWDFRHYEWSKLVLPWPPALASVPPPMAWPARQQGQGERWMLPFRG